LRWPIFSRNLWLSILAGMLAYWLLGMIGF
jgi:hypothetical protein